MKKLVLLVEGHGDIQAAKVLVKRLIKEMGVSDVLWVDEQPMRVGEVKCLTGKNAVNWIDFLKRAAKRPGAHGVLLLLDGDADKVEQQPFCAKTVATALAARSKEAGGGQGFSVACVFACQEFESWFIAGIDSLAGKPLADGRPGIKAGTRAPELDLEKHPRDAKKWLAEHMQPGGYKPTTDQHLLAKDVDLAAIRLRQPRSFKRLETALQEMATAFREGKHFVSPCERISP